MGGSIAWTLRLGDGTEHRMTRWTNTMKQLVMNPEFLSGSEKGIQSALSEWILMRDDWFRNKESGQFNHPITPVYAPLTGLMPIEYGLLVTDFQSKSILAMQDYTSFRQVNLYRHMYGAHMIKGNPSAYAHYRELADAGRLCKHTFLLETLTAATHFEHFGWTIEKDPHDELWTATHPGPINAEDLERLCDKVRDDIPSDPEQSKIDGAKKALEEGRIAEDEREKLATIIEIFENSHRSKHNPIYSAHAYIDCAPFTLKSFERTSLGMKAFLVEINSIGFTLSPEEEKYWQHAISNAEQFEEEEEE